MCLCVRMCVYVCLTGYFQGSYHRIERISSLHDWTCKTPDSVSVLWADGGTKSRAAVRCPPHTCCFKSLLQHCCALVLHDRAWGPHSPSSERLNVTAHRPGNESLAGMGRNTGRNHQKMNLQEDSGFGKAWCICFEKSFLNLHCI